MEKIASPLAEGPRRRLRRHGGPGLAGPPLAGAIPGSPPTKVRSQRGRDRPVRLRLRRLLHRPFLLFNIAPIFFGVYVAFTDGASSGRTGSASQISRGLPDDGSASPSRTRCVYGLIIVPCVTVLGLTFALFVNQRWPLSSLARDPVLLPLRRFGDGDRAGLGLAARYPVRPSTTISAVGIAACPWLTSSEWSLIGVSIASVWWDLGLAFVLFLAALQDVPRGPLRGCPSTVPAAGSGSGLSSCRSCAP